jgi:hypothetical protein
MSVISLSEDKILFDHIFKQWVGAELKYLFGTIMNSLRDFSIWIYKQHIKPYLFAREFCVLLLSFFKLDRLSCNIDES